MKRIKIREPIWATHSIGIADYLLTENIEIEITYINLNRIKLYPDTYIATPEFIKQFPTQIRKKIVLHIVPINQLTVKPKSKEAQLCF